MTLDGAFTKLGDITTPHLCLHQMKIADAEAVFAFKSDPKVTLCYGQEPHRTIEETKIWLKKRVNDYEARGSVFWVLTLKDNDVAIGECCFWNFDPGFRSAEIGYELHSQYWHKGYMTEAVAEVIAYGFREMDLHRIEACPYDNNNHSHDLLRKLGFKEEGRLRERHFFRGKFEDQLYFGLLRDEWKRQGQDGKGDPHRA